MSLFVCLDEAADHYRRRARNIRAKPLRRNKFHHRHAALAWAPALC